MSNFRAWPAWLVLLVAGNAVAVTCLVIFLGVERLPVAAAAVPEAAKATSTEGEKVVCIGFVDLPHGVASLVPLQIGRVKRIAVSENQEVKAGDVLIELDDSAAQIQVQEARAELKATQAARDRAKNLVPQYQAKVRQQQGAIEAARQRVAGARILALRQENLVRDRLLAVEEAAITQAKVKELEAMVKVEEARLSELELQDATAEMDRLQEEIPRVEAKLALAENQWSEYKLKAAEPGKVLRILAAEGDVLGPQSRSPAVMFASNRPRIIRAEIDQEFGNRVAVGSKAIIEDDVNSAIKQVGKVIQLSDWYSQQRALMGEFSRPRDVRTRECVVALEPGQPTLAIGQRVRVTIGGQ